MKKYLWISTIFSIFLLIGGWITISPFNKAEVNSRNTHLVTIKGAVYDSLESKVLDGVKVEEIIYRAHLLLNADITTLNLKQEIRKDENIFIPYKEGTEPKIDTRDGLTKAEIDKLGVNKNLADALYKLFKEKENWITWDDIDDLPGTGEVTMARLKKLLIIQNSH